MTMRRKHSPQKSDRHHHHSQHQEPSVYVSKKLSSTPTEIDTLVIGSSVVRYVSSGQYFAIVKSNPGARVSHIEKAFIVYG